MFSAVSKLRFIVCEDGNEYLERFRRFLGEEFDFAVAHDYAQVCDVIDGAGGLLMDLDFRRTPADRLIDERGAFAGAPDDGTRRRLAETQGILILRQLRATGVSLRAILFADLDDGERARFLERTLAPLTIAGSQLGLRDIAALMRARRAAR
jgi:hypothetical protein